MAKTDIINNLIRHFGYKSYLEIGVQHKVTFNKVLCEKRIGVDPDRTMNATYVMTSDQFFEQNKETFDLIFIDGLHEAAQTHRDISNALAALNLNGTIVVHDCNPTHKNMQKVPRMVKEWTGDVWKAWMYFRSTINYFKLNMFVIDIDYGVGIIRRGKQILIDEPELTYEELEKHRKVWLNLVRPDEYMEYL